MIVLGRLKFKEGVLYVRFQTLTAASAKMTVSLLEYSAV
jgi:hypothetical protein